MNKIKIVFESLTQAQRSKRILKSIGIETRIIKVDPKSDDDGCRFGFEIKRNDYFMVISRLIEEKIAYSVI